MNWKAFWEKFPEQFNEEEFIKQVGKTVKGQPISQEQLDRLILDVAQKLNLKEEDWALDLCCGNGLITSAIAKKCQYTVGVDFSQPLIELARQYHSQKNVNYVHLSVLDLTRENLGVSRPFTKIYMYEGLQYFQENQLSALIETILSLASESVTILLAGIPDRSRIWSFYDTPERQREYELRKSQGTEAIGTWWEKSLIRQVCSNYGLQCEFLPQHELSHTAHYRFDARIQKQ